MAAALVKGSEKKFGASECSGNIGFLARQPLLPPTIQIVAPLQLNPWLPNRYIAERIFCRSNLFSLYKHAKVRWDQMKISECWASWILKRCCIDFYKFSTEHNLLPVKDKMCNIWSSQSVSLSVVVFRDIRWTFTRSDSSPIPSNRRSGFVQSEKFISINQLTPQKVWSLCPLIWRRWGRFLLLVNWRV